MMPTPQTATENQQLQHIGILSDVRRLARVLPKFLSAVRDERVSGHPLWGSAIPFGADAYGRGPSLGHCIRPDIVVTDDGRMQISEFDFVPSGRGFTLDALATSSLQTRFLEPFERWYASMSPMSPVLYGTATKTTCWEESQHFAQLLRETYNTDIRAVNLDSCELSEDVLIDRLSYRSEMKNLARRTLKHHQVLTAEPYLDSKALFALVHDQSMNEVFCSHMGFEDLEFLRSVMPETYLLEALSEEHIRAIAEKHRDWVIKSTEVETDACWGSRGTIIGCKYSKAKFAEALDGTAPGRKSMGDHPIVQRFASSADYTALWNAAVVSGAHVADPSRFGKGGGVLEERTTLPARKKVYARFGVYLLVCNVTERVFYAPFAAVTLRQDQLVHGTSDAIFSVVEMN